MFDGHIFGVQSYRILSFGDVPIQKGDFQVQGLIFQGEPIWFCAPHLTYTPKFDTPNDGVLKSISFQIWLMSLVFMLNFRGVVSG